MKLFLCDSYIKNPDQDYRLLVKNILEQKRKSRPRFTQAKLSESSGLHQTFLSRVFSEKAHLSDDQLYLACSFLELSTIDTNILCFISNMQQSDLTSRKRGIKSKIDLLVQQQLKSEKTLKENTKISNAEMSNQYYSDPYVGIVHMFLCIQKYVDEPQLIRMELGLSQERFRNLIEVLLNLDLIEKIQSENTRKFCTKKRK